VWCQLPKRDHVTRKQASRFGRFIIHTIWPGIFAGRAGFNSAALLEDVFACLSLPRSSLMLTLPVPSGIRCSDWKRYTFQVADRERRTPSRRTTTYTGAAAEHNPKFTPEQSVKLISPLATHIHIMWLAACNSGTAIQGSQIYRILMKCDGIGPVRILKSANFRI
jgi:hypothetical protein